MPPRFSVFIPVLDGASWLPGAIESVLAQRCTDWELVVGDNASEDDLAAVLARYSDPRIRYHRWTTRVDIFKNFNRTMGLCEAPWVLLLCVDDRLHPGCLEAMSGQIDAGASRSRRLGMVITAARRIGPDGEPIDVEYYGFRGPAVVPAGTFDAAGWLRVLSTPGSPPWDGGAFAREVIEQMALFYREDDPNMSADLELTLRIAAYADVVYIDEPLLVVSGWAGSHTHGRRMRNRASGDRLTPEASALLSALHAHDEQRTVKPDERALIHGMIARSYLRRAAGHRYLPGGRGRRGALVDVARAVRFSPSTAFAPAAFAYSLVDILAPRALLVAIRRIVLARRARSVGQRLLAP